MSILILKQSKNRYNNQGFRKYADGVCVLTCKDKVSA